MTFTCDGFLLMRLKCKNHQNFQGSQACMRRVLLGISFLKTYDDILQKIKKKVFIFMKMRFFVIIQNYWIIFIRAHGFDFGLK